MASTLNKFQTADAPAPGIYRGVPAAEYRTWRAWNWSTMNQLTPAHVKAKFSAPPEPEAGATRFGSLVHEIMLEPEGFDAGRFVEIERTHAKSKKGRALAWDSPAEDWAWAEDNTEGEPIPVGGLDDLRAACGAFYRNPAAAAIWRATPRENKEISIVWKCPLTSLPMKARLDIVTDSEFQSEHIGGAWIGDIKTTAKKTPVEFGKDVFNKLYHGQAAHYVAGYKALTGDDLPFFYAVQYKDPDVQSVQILRGMDNLIRSGEKLRERIVLGIAKSVVSGEWPGHEPIASLPIPAWAEDRFEMDI